LPLHLRDIAGLTKDAVLVGMSKTFEIWSPERWEKQGGE
jgi:MraZ protein